MVSGVVAQVSGQIHSHAVNTPQREFRPLYILKLKERYHMANKKQKANNPSG